MHASEHQPAPATPATPAAHSSTHPNPYRQLLIMIILLAVIALVVVNALKGSPWGTFTIAATMPIAVGPQRLRA